MSQTTETNEAKRTDVPKIARIYGKAILRLMLNATIAGAITLCGISILYFMGIDIGHRRADQPILPEALFFLVIFITACILGRRTEAVFEKAQEEAAKHYTPPVRPEALPAEEILVRGANAPVSPERESLLRAAHDARATDTDELLRPEDGPDAVH